jgi:hypothetical protein
MIFLRISSHLQISMKIKKPKSNDINKDDKEELTFTTK